MGFGKDVITGTGLIVLGIVMTWVAAGFPQIGGMAYGPDLFPRIIAGGLTLSGIGILLEVWRGAAPSHDRMKLSWLPIFLLAAIVAGFAILLPLLGFHIATALVLFASVQVFRGSWMTSIVVSAIGPFILHYIFYNLLRVPLPWGLLTPIAW